MRVHYYSERLGLAPLMVGLLRGLVKRFGTEVDVAHDQIRGPERDHDEFLVRYSGAGPTNGDG
jgi:hypothetical protein